MARFGGTQPRGLAVEMTERFGVQIVLDGLPFEILDEGRGPAVVLLHGFPLAKEIWDAQACALAADARVVRPDLRCLGGSAVTPGPVLMETLAADVAALLDALGIDRAIVVGHSLGTYVAFSFFRLFAERVAGLGLVCGRPEADDAPGRQRRFDLANAAERSGIEPVLDFYVPRLLAPKEYDPPARLAERVAAICARTDPRGAAALLRGMAMRSGASDILAEVAVPVRVIAGADDRLLSVEVQTAMARSIGGAALDVVDSGHLPQLESPDAVTQSLRQLVVECVAR